MLGGILIEYPFQLFSRSSYLYIARRPGRALKAKLYPHPAGRLRSTLLASEVAVSVTVMMAASDSILYCIATALYCH